MVGTPCLYFYGVAVDLREREQRSCTQIDEISRTIVQHEGSLKDLANALTTLTECMRQMEVQPLARSELDSRNKEEASIESKDREKRFTADGRKIVDQLGEEAVLTSEKWSVDKLADVLRETMGIDVDVADSFSQRAMGLFLMKYRAELEVAKFKNGLLRLTISRQLNASGAIPLVSPGTQLPSPVKAGPDEKMVVHSTVHGPDGVRQFRISSSEFPEILQINEDRKDALARLIAEASEYARDAKAE